MVTGVLTGQRWVTGLLASRRPQQSSSAPQAPTEAWVRVPWRCREFATVSCVSSGSARCHQCATCCESSRTGSPLASGSAHSPAWERRHGPGAHIGCSAPQLQKPASRQDASPRPRRRGRRRAGRTLGVGRCTQEGDHHPSEGREDKFAPR